MKFRYIFLNIEIETTNGLLFRGISILDSEIKNIIKKYGIIFLLCITLYSPKKSKLFMNIYWHKYQNLIIKNKNKNRNRNIYIAMHSTLKESTVYVKS